MPDPALPLNTATELVGEWYEPGQEDQPASGRLLFDPVEGLTLEVVTGFAPLFMRDEIPVMLGVTVDGRLVTLRNVLQRRSRSNSRGGTLATARVSTAFVGAHASTPDELRLWHLDARLSHLNENSGSARARSFVSSSATIG